MQSSSPLDNHRGLIEGLVREGATSSEIEERLLSYGVKTSRSSIQRAVRRWNLELKRKTVAQQRAKVTTYYALKKVGEDVPPSLEMDVTGRSDTQDLDKRTADKLLEEHGFDINDWKIDRSSITHWDSPTGDVLKRLKVDVSYADPYKFVKPARIDGPKYKVSQAPQKGDSYLTVVCGDQQAPHHDPGMHEAFCRWLKANNPREGVLLGDLLDLATLSKYTPNPRWNNELQENINSGYDVLHDYRVNSLITKWKKLLGNHEIRLPDYIIKNAPAVYGLTRAHEDLGVFTFENLLRLDELGIEVVEFEDNLNYKDACVVITPDLVVRHGEYTRSKGGESALAMVNKFDVSVISGHTHRLAISHQTVYDAYGNPKKNLVGVETGCMTTVAHGLGYDSAPNWQNGFATVEVFNDGTFHVDLAKYEHGNLVWRGKRW